MPEVRQMAQSIELGGEPIEDPIIVVIIFDRKIRAVVQPDPAAEVQPSQMPQREQRPWQYRQPQAPEVEKPRPPHRFLGDALLGDGLSVERFRHAGRMAWTGLGCHI